RPNEVDRYRLPGSRGTRDRDRRGERIRAVRRFNRVRASATRAKELSLKDRVLALQPFGNRDGVGKRLSIVIRIPGDRRRTFGLNGLIRRESAARFAPARRSHFAAAVWESAAVD